MRNNPVKMSTDRNPPAVTSLQDKRVELKTLSDELRVVHLQILETSNLLKQESKELSQESRMLRNIGHRLGRRR